MIIYKNRIIEPNMVSIDEDAFFKFKINDLSNHYNKVFKHNKKNRKFFVRWIFRIVLLSNKDIILILAGSLASVPVNILTGFYGSNSYTYFDWILHVLQLIASVLFYSFFLRFVRVYLYIHSKGEEYVNYIFAKSSHNSREKIMKAVKNVEYYFCIKEYKKVQVSIICLLVFLGVLVVLLFVPPNSFEDFIKLCINKIKNLLLFWR